jgi:hypothetical protein
MVIVFLLGAITVRAFLYIHDRAAWAGSAAAAVGRR